MNTKPVWCAVPDAKARFGGLTTRLALWIGCVALGAGLIGAGITAPGQPGPDENPPALVNGQALPWSEMRDLLAETAGGAILEEVVLDRLLKQRCRSEGITIDEAAVAAERQRLLDVLDRDQERALAALSALRIRRGLGDRRFALLLRRNAMLRALVGEEFEVTDVMIRKQYDAEYGAKFRVRLFTAATVADAQRALDEIRDGKPFVDVAALSSTDSASAQRGGLLDPISPLDPSYPMSLRRVLEDLEAGDISPIFPIDSGFAFVQMVERVPASTVAFEQVRRDVERTVRLTQQRILMENLARQMIEQARIVVMDPALGESWKARRGGP